MNLQYHPGTAVLVGGALLCVLAGILSWERRATRGSTWFIWAIASCIVWSITQAVEINCQSIHQSIFWSKLSYFGIATLPVFWFLFALRYQERVRQVNEEIIPLFFIVPAATILAALTNESHRLIWTSVTQAPNGLRVYGHGPVFWVFVFYCYILLMSGTVLIVRSVLRQHDIYKQQATSILFGVAFPLVGNATYLAGFPLVQGMDPTPFFFGISALWILMALSERRLFDLSPIARDTLVESMSDGLLVLDKYHRVVDINPAAQLLLNIPIKDNIGEPIETVLAALPKLQEICQATTPAETTLLLSEDSGRHLSIRTILLRKQGTEAVGKVLMLRDVTEEKSIEAELRSLNHRLQDQLTQIHQLKDRLQDQANHDPLTGLYNRRYLIQTLESLLSSHKYPLSLVMVDVDLFKSINDRYGHLTGDLVLHTIANLLQSQVSGAEFVCRYGGEEFVVILPDVTLPKAVERAEHWCNLFQVTPAKVDGQRIQATLSMGVAAAPESGTDLESLLQAADKALYTAKKRGRNQVVVQSSCPPAASVEIASKITR